MNLTVNGQITPTLNVQSVCDLLVHLGLDGRPVAVEVNQELIPRKQHGQTLLHEGDEIELMTLVGGG